VQRLQIEPVSQASARQRKGRCGRVRDGVCVRLYEEHELTERPEFTDPEIRRSSLAGVVLRMKALGLPEIEDFPFLDPPSPKAIAEGYRTLREVSALDREKNLTDYGRPDRPSPSPILASDACSSRPATNSLAEVLPIVAALESSDPRERPAEKAGKRMPPTARWKDGDSDFIGLLRLWQDLARFRDARGRWQRNALRKYCGPALPQCPRVMEWANVRDELADLLEREWKLQLGAIGDSFSGSAAYATIHKASSPVSPANSASGTAIQNPTAAPVAAFLRFSRGSGLFALPKRFEWVMAMELVETSRLWARRVARIDPAWVEHVAPHLCKSKYGEAHWDEAQGAVYGKENRHLRRPFRRRGAVHPLRSVDPKAARSIFLREGIIGNGLRKRCKFIDHVGEMRAEVELIEHKLRRPGGLWSDDAVCFFYESKIPEGMHTASAFHKWLEHHEESLMLGIADVLDEDLADLGLAGFPDTISHAGSEYSGLLPRQAGRARRWSDLRCACRSTPAVSRVAAAWGVDGHLAERAEIPPPLAAQGFPPRLPTDRPHRRKFCGALVICPKDRPITQALSEHVKERLGAYVPVGEYDSAKLPPERVTKIWICDDDGEELAMGEDVALLKLQLSERMKVRFERWRMPTSPAKDFKPGMANPYRSGLRLPVVWPTQRWSMKEHPSVSALSRGRSMPLKVIAPAGRGCWCSPTLNQSPTCGKSSRLASWRRWSCQGWGRGAHPWNGSSCWRQRAQLAEHFPDRPLLSAK
jgi:ATP-dependent helicase HrpA